MENKTTIFLNRASLPPYEEYINEIRSCWDTRWITTMGPKHMKLEALLQEYLEVDNVKLFSNGHTALESVIQALDLKGEVITTPFTFASTTHAIIKNNLIPRFCDINMSNYNIDVTKIEELITPSTTAIVAVHIFGNVCDVEVIEKIAKKHNLKVIYDAAHAFGVKRFGKSIARYGDATMYSFHASKVYNTIEGGAIAFNRNKSLDEVLEKIRLFGVGNDEYVEMIGTNGKMNEFEAAMGICNLKHISEEIDKRKMADEFYRVLLKDVKGIKMNDIPKYTQSNYCYFPILLDNTFRCSRDTLFNELQANGVMARKHFYQLTNQYPCYPIKFQRDITPNAEYVSKNILSLPLFSGISKKDIEFICSIIKGTHNH